MSVFSDIVRKVTGRGVGENVGRAVGAYFGGPVGATVGQEAGGRLSEELSRVSKQAETTTSQTAPSNQGPVMPTGPAQNIEIDFRGDSDMPLLNTAQMGNNPFIEPAVYQQANIIISDM